MISFSANVIYHSILLWIARHKIRYNDVINISTRNVSYLEYLVKFSKRLNFRMMYETQCHITVYPFS